MGFETERIRAELDLDNVQYVSALRAVTEAEDEHIRKMVEATQATKAVNLVIDEETVRIQRLTAEKKKLETQTNDTSQSNVKLGQAALTTSYAIQDFTSQIGTRGLAGALGAVQNNIPGLLMSLGMSGGIAGAVSIVSVGLGVLANQFLDTGKAQDTLREKTDGATEALNRQRKALMDLREFGAADKEKERATNLQAEFGGQQGAIVDEIEESRGTGARDQIEREERRLAGLLAMPGQDPANRNALRSQLLRAQQRKRSLEASLADRRKQTEQMVAGAMIGGSEADLRSTVNSLPLGDMRDRLNAQLPEMIDADEAAQADFDAGIQKRQEAMPGVRQRRAALDKFGKGTDKTAQDFTDKMNSPARRAKVAQIQADTAAGEAVQAEAANQGMDIDFRSAVQIAKQRQAELKRAQGEFLGVIAGMQSDTSDQLRQFREATAMMNAMRSQNRTAQLMGGN
jgi:hypothetical protein